jgi:hypothetical protein
MTTARSPRVEPGRDQRLRPSDERALLAHAARTNRRIAVLALLGAVVALGLVAWRFVLPGDAGCQSAAWAASPAIEELPPGWSVSSSQYDVSRKTMTLLGPLPSDSTTNQAVLYATVTCYPQGAAESVSRSADAAAAAGQTVTSRSDLGDQGFLATDASGAIFLQFRHADVVVYIAASGDATSDEVDAVASAFDRAMGGDGAAVAIGTPDTGAPSPSADQPSADASAAPIPTESPAAPELEAAMPTQVGDITLTVESALGTDILGDDQGSRAIIAALRADGKTPDDLRVAQAYDATGQADLRILGVSVTGMSLDSIKALVISSWLAATGPGVSTDTVTLGGHEFTRIDYGDGGSVDYLLAEGDHVLLIETADATLAEQAAAALP